MKAALSPTLSMPIDRDIRHLRNAFPAPRFVTRFAARSLHIRLSKLGIPDQDHYDVARLWCIALGTMPASEPTLWSLTELSNKQYSSLMVFTHQQLQERGEAA